MASFTFASAGIQLALKGERTFLEAYPNPWLVWLTAVAGAPVVRDTRGGASGVVNAGGEPMAFELVKTSAGNGFPLGITVGHTENNDVVIRDERISRFHAFFQVTPSSVRIHDAESTNGTFVEGLRLARGASTPLKNGAHLHLGTLALQFHTAEGFVELLRGELARVATK